jgi:hypothetical protein
MLNLAVPKRIKRLHTSSSKVAVERRLYSVEGLDDRGSSRGRAQGTVPACQDAVRNTMHIAQDSLLRNSNSLPANYGLC